ncbi:MAG TPA: sugar phosphate isomerase/epimerase, partial [Flavobacterium sp.]|nr:sugar phosphate isomerase/epimerase [Flavobacterium sp.]
MNKRREFLINSGLVLGTLAITPSLAFTTKKRAIGIQLWTMRETLPKDVKGV